jgi:hypothetical protein
MKTNRGGERADVMGGVGGAVNGAVSAAKRRQVVQNIECRQLSDEPQLQSKHHQLGHHEEPDDASGA